MRGLYGRFLSSTAPKRPRTSRDLAIFALPGPRTHVDCQGPGGSQLRFHRAPARGGFPARAFCSHRPRAKAEVTNTGPALDCFGRPRFRRACPLALNAETALLPVEQEDPRCCVGRLDHGSTNRRSCGPIHKSAPIRRACAQWTLEERTGDLVARGGGARRRTVDRATTRSLTAQSSVRSKRDHFSALYRIITHRSCRVRRGDHRGAISNSQRTAGTEVVLKVTKVRASLSSLGVCATFLRSSRAWRRWPVGLPDSAETETPRT